MSARRQASSTSLSKFVRDGSPDNTVRSLDFCNAFWGPSDAGVDVLFARIRGATRTMEELRNFWKERYLTLTRLSDHQFFNASFRASIEEEYAKRLSKLAKQTLGRDEIGCVSTSGLAPSI
jgi:Fes/CIP4, and EFC/F-BAR homology domain